MGRQEDICRWRAEDNPNYDFTVTRCKCGKIERCSSGWSAPLFPTLISRSSVAVMSKYNPPGERATRVEIKAK